jgi:hypothetical protein
MFANELDPPSVREARQLQLQATPHPPHLSPAPPLVFPTFPTIAAAVLLSSSFSSSLFVYSLRIVCASLLTPPQHVKTWLAPPLSPALPPQCFSSAAGVVWLWVAIALFTLQLASLALFKRYISKQRQGHIKDESRAPLLV